MELISREEALKVFGNIHSLDYNAQAYKSKIEKIPTIESRPKGEWIEIKYRKPTEEEKERYPEAEEWFDCELPEHGEEVLVTTAYNNLIAMTTFANYGDDGCEFEDYDAEDIIAWCRLPEPYIAEKRGEE